MPKESTIQHYSSTVTGNAPAAIDLSTGELAINVADEKVFFKNLGGNIVSLSQTKDLSGAFASKSTENTFTQMQTFSAGISASGATFSGNISAPNIVNSFNGNIGAVQGVSAVVGSTYVSVSGSTGSVTFTNTGVQTFNGLTGAVTGVASIRGLTGAVGITNGTGIGLSVSGQTMTFSNTGVLSVNGSTGTITNVAKTDEYTNFAALNNFLTVTDTNSLDEIRINPTSNKIVFYDGSSENDVQLYVSSFGNQVITFPDSTTRLAGLSETQTFTSTNTFVELTNFASGISAAASTFYGNLIAVGATFSGNISVAGNATLGNAATDTTTIYGSKVVNEFVFNNGTARTVGISWANGNVQLLGGTGSGATGATAIYFTSAPATGSASVTLIVTSGGSMTGNTTFWGGNIKWPGGNKPTLSSNGTPDVISFVTPDAGTTIYGFVGGLNFA